MNQHIFEHDVEHLTPIPKSHYLRRFMTKLIVLSLPFLLLFFTGTFFIQAMNNTQLAPSLVADIYVGGDDSRPEYLTVLDGKLYFAADDGNSTDPNLYVHDPLNGTTALVATVPSSLTIHEIGVFQGKLYLNGDDDVLGRELWLYDPAVPTTTLVADIRSGSGNSNPRQFTEIDGKLYFRAYEVATGVELWVHDPVSNTTTLVADILGGASSSAPSYLTVLNGKLYFDANYAPVNRGMFEYDPATDMLELVFNSARTAEYITALDNKLYFGATHSTYGKELWVYDPISDTAEMVDDLYPGGFSSSPQHITALDGKIYFHGGEGTYGRELWVYDPISSTMSLVADIWSGSNNGIIQYLTVVNDKLYFSADDSIRGQEIWVHDPTVPTTTLAVEIAAGSSGSNPRELTFLNNQLFFGADESTYGAELWSASFPLAQDIAATTAEETAVLLTPLNGSNSLTITHITTPTNGVAMISGTTQIVYTPTQDYNGADAFSYSVTDGTMTDTATIAVTVTPINDLPIAVSDVYTTTWNTPLTTVIATGVLTNDSDVDGPALLAALNSDVMTGTLTLNNDGTFTYMPPINFFGAVTFTYQATDTLAFSANAVTVTLNVICPPSTAVSVYVCSYQAGDDVGFDWLHNPDEGSGYHVWVDSTAYFTLTDGTILSTTTTLQTFIHQSHNNVLNTLTPYFYYIEASACPMCATPYSNHIGKFTFLVEPGN